MNQAVAICWWTIVAIAVGGAASVHGEEAFRDVYYERLHRESVAAIDFSPDGQTLATISLDRTVKIYAWRARKSLATLKDFPLGDGEGTHDRKIRFVDGGKKILTANHGGPIQLREWATNALVWSTPVGGRSVALSPGEDSLLTADWESQWVSRWDMKTGKLVAQLPGSPAKLASGCWSQGNVAWAHSGKYFASACGGTRDDAAVDTRVVVWDAATHKPLKEYTIEGLRAHAMQFSPHDEELLVGTTEGKLHVLKLQPAAKNNIGAAKIQELIDQLDDDRYPVRDRAHEALVAANIEALPILQAALPQVKSYEAQVRLGAALAVVTTRAQNRTVLDELHAGTILSVAFSPDGRYLATGCRTYQKNQGTIVIRDRKTHSLALHIHGAGVTSVTFSPDGRYFGAAYQDGCVRVWELASPAVISTESK